MQNSYQLKVTPIAEADLEAIYLYISKHLVAPKAVNELMNEIENAIMRLTAFPYSGSPVKDDILRSRGYRRLIVKNYIVFYMMNEAEKQVVVMRVFYSGQKYENIL